MVLKMLRKKSTFKPECEPHKYCLGQQISKQINVVNLNTINLGSNMKKVE